MDFAATIAGTDTMRRTIQGLLKLRGFAGEGVIDRVCEGRDLLEAALRDLMLLTIIPDGSAVRLLRTVPR